MKRVLILLLLGGMFAGAWLLPAPEPEEVAVVSTTLPLDEPAIRAFALCPWASSEGSLNGLLSMVAPGDTTATVTFPSAGEIRDTRQLALEGLSGVALDFSELAFEGQVPSVVEFTSAASAGVVSYDDTMLIGAGCAATIPKIWLLPGGSTRAGDTLDLQLFNPFPEDARVTVTMTNPTDFEPEPGLEGITVNALSWRTIDIAARLPLRESLSATIEVERGVVIPAFVQIGPSDRALWTGVDRSDTWEFPLVAVPGLSADLVLSNPNSLDVPFVIDRFGSTSSELQMLDGVVEAGKHTRISLDEVVTELSGLQVRAEGLLGAVIVGESEQARAVTAGASSLASSWLVPGLGSVAGAESQLWILNTSAAQVSVTYSTLNENGTDRSGKVAVTAGSMRRISLPAGESSGVFVQATAPISVGASMQRGDAVAYLAPVPLPDE